MNLIADGLLMATAMVAGLYCLVLSRRLRRLTDSGSGIGSQIAALDRALAETRGALTETRDGVSELRASARAAIAELRRRTENGETAATSLAEATGKAEAVLQRLYEAQDRVAAVERQAEGKDPPAGPGRDLEGASRQPIVLEVEGGHSGGAPSGPPEERPELLDRAAGDGRRSGEETRAIEIRKAGGGSGK